MIENHFKAIIETQLLGIIRVSLTMPFEHFLDRLKTDMQVKLSQASPIQSLVQIYNERGIKGYFSGFQPSFLRNVLKQYYRWPMMILIPNHVNQYVQNPILSKTITGVSIGLFESVIICPLERLKTVYMTRVYIPEKGILKLDLVGLKYLYTGFQIQTTRQIVSWTSFLYWDHKLRYLFKDQRSDKLTPLQVVFCSFASIHPFDTVKTLYQMDANHEHASRNPITILKETYATHGLKGLYSGWQMRISAFFCQALLTTPAIDYLDRKHGKF